MGDNRNTGSRPDIRVAPARFVRALCSAVFSVAIVAGPARAEKIPDYVKDMAGEWLVATDDGKPGCRVKLETARTIGGWRAVPAQDCPSRNPKVAAATAWDFDGGIRLRDATRKLLYEFGEDETTIMKTRGEAVPVTLIVQAAAGVDRAPYAPDLLGRWAMRRPGGPTICEVTLAKGPRKDGEDTFTLKTGSPCDPAVTKLKLSSWAVDDFKLAFYGDTDASLTFEPRADGFAKTDGGKPLDLVRVR